MLNVVDLIKPAQEILGPVGSTLGDAWQAVIGDRVAAWRLANVVEVHKRTQKRLAESGLSLNSAKIPERYAFAWFEEASKQDEPDLQTVFANLLANAAAGNEAALDRRLLSIASQLTPTDAKVLDELFGGSFGKSHLDAQPYVFATPSWERSSLNHSIADKFGTDGLLALEHLIALGTLTAQAALKHRPSRSLSTSGGTTVSILETVQVTRTGVALYQAVSTPDKLV